MKHRREASSKPQRRPSKKRAQERYVKAPGNRGKKTKQKAEDMGHRDENGQEATEDRKARLGDEEPGTGPP